MSAFPLRLPEDLKHVATAQAEAAGVSLNQFVATGRSGDGNPPGDGDKIE